MTTGGTKHLHVDPFSGASGDMWLGLAIDLGADPDLLRALPGRLGLDGVEVEVGRAQRGGIDAARVTVTVSAAGERPARTRRELLAIVARAELPERAARWATEAFERLLAAEARVHGTGIDRVHLHEAGADDALVDIAGTALLLDALGVGSVSCTAPLPLGGGEIRAAHGALPVPAPATAALLEGVPVQGGPVERELITPTGAALLRALVTRFGPAPPLRLERSGFGAGGSDDAQRPNVLRGLLGEPAGGAGERALSILSCAVDDLPPSDVPVLIERLLADGARDAFVQSVTMKKGRPGFLITVLADPERERGLAERLLADSTTLGVRIHREARFEWERDSVAVATPWGPVRVKRAIDPSGRVRRGMPEFDDVRELADRHARPVDEVRQAAREAFSRQNERSPGRRRDDPEGR